MAEPPGRLLGFLRELKRRNVYRVAVAYAGVAFVVWQVADHLFPALDFPAWTTDFVVVFTVLGLPVALVLAWAFEMTPGGIARTRDRDGTDDADRSDAGVRLEGDQEPLDSRRLAILPLASIDPDREGDYFADGMTEELISVVSRVRDLEVIARTSVMAYRETTKSVTEIGRELGVGTILEGSVRRAGDQLRVTVQLIDVETQAHLWSRDYDRELREVFRVQSDIARKIASALEVTLVSAEKRRIERTPTDDLEAYDLYLLGRHHLNRRTDAGLRRAVEQFESAVRLDPGFAPAHAGLADAYVLAGIGYAAIPDALSRALASAERALDLDRELPEARISLGYAALNHDWDWKTAEHQLARAIELNPSDARAHQWHSHVSLYRRRWAEAAARIERARELDPLSVVIQNESGWPYLYMDDFDEAMSRFREAAGMDGSFAMAHFNMANCYHARGRLEEAVACYRKALDLSGGMPFVVGQLGAALAEAGRRDEARELLDQLEGQAEVGAAVALWRAVVEEALGEKAAALDHLEQALEAREPVFVAIDTTWVPLSSLKEEQRFQDIRRTIADHFEMDRT